MPSEAHKTHRFKEALKDRLGFDGFIIKHSDKFTAGIPDTTITYNGRTLWLEFKKRPDDFTGSFSDLLKASNRKSKIQMFNLWRLDRTSQGRAFYIVFEPDRRISIVRVSNPYANTFEHLITDSQQKVINTLLSFC